MNTNEKKIDLTQGSILTGFFLFAVPLFLSSLFQLMYGTVDLLFVGNFLGKTDAAAVGASSILVTCLIGLFTGISVGTGVVTSQFWGAGKEDRVLLCMENGLLLGAAGGMFLTILGLFLSSIISTVLERMQCNLFSAAVIFCISAVVLFLGRPILGLFCKEEEVIEEGLRIIRVSFPFYFIYAILEVTGGIVRGMGKTLQSMMIVIMNLCVIRVLLLTFLVSSFHTVQAVAAVYPLTWALAAVSFVSYYIFLFCREKI